MKLAARAILPAIVAVVGLWATGVYGMRSTFANPLLLLGCYGLGFGMLLYAEKGLHLERTSRFYAYYSGLVLAAGVLATSFLRQPLLAAANSFLVLPLVMFLLPAAFQLVQERLKDVQPE